MIATAINLPCPSQEAGGGKSIHADFWHPVRNRLHEKHGKQLHVLAWTGAGGDVTSRQAFGNAADERMRKLSGNVSRLDQIAHRIVTAWDDALEGARHDIRSDVPFQHHGIQMKARSPGIQSFIIQLAGPGTYLPTERAVKHGGYGAVIQSSQIGPDGGQALVEQTIQAWKQFWPAAKAPPTTK